MAKSDYLQNSKKYKGYHYSVLASSELEYLHKRTLEMFLQVKRVFEENNIRYMICGGTLLGALGGGHGHFIPWDDDFDICIFEEDYEKAVECLMDKEKGLPNGMVLQCTQTDPNYYLGWMKIRDQHSHTYPDAPVFKENGVWIDLYKLVKAKAADVPLIIAREAIAYLDRRLSAGGLTLEQYNERIADGHLCEKLDEARKKSMNDDCKQSNRNVYIIWSASKIVLEEKWLEALITVNFEGIEVTTFVGAKEYLIQHYGDSYMNYPIDELRRVGINKIEWDK